MVPIINQIALSDSCIKSYIHYVCIIAGESFNYVLRSSSCLLEVQLKNGAWLPFCFETFYYNNATEYCRQLEYSSPSSYTPIHSVSRYIISEKIKTNHVLTSLQSLMNYYTLDGTVNAY